MFAARDLCAPGRRCAWFDKIKIPAAAPALYDVTEYELIGLREDDHLLNMVRPCFLIIVVVP